MQAVAATNRCVDRRKSRTQPMCAIVGATLRTTVAPSRRENVYRECMHGWPASSGGQVYRKPLDGKMQIEGEVNPAAAASTCP